jgi:hypothetical protein
MAQNGITKATWPKSLQGGRIQQLIDTMFRSADDPSPAGSVRFSECFTTMGELVARGHICKGREGETDILPHDPNRDTA